MPKQDNTISLVLGSGGARGLAHIGIIREFEDNGYTIGSIAGASAGALVGGIHAAGKLDDFTDWISAVSKADIVNLLDIAWEKNGLVKGDKVIQTLRELVGDKRIEDLAIPFTAVATDIKRQKEVWLNSGSLFDAIRASISLPFFFTPVSSDGALLIDGGVLNPVPIAPAFNDDTDLIVAVNLSGSPVDDPDALLADADTGKQQSQSFFNRKLSEFIEDLSKSMQDSKSEWDMYDIGNQAFDAMQGTIARQKLAAYPPDHTIEIPRNACKLLDFDRAAAMIRLGRERARELLDGLEA